MPTENYETRRVPVLEFNDETRYALLMKGVQYELELALEAYGEGTRSLAVAIHMTRASILKQMAGELTIGEAEETVSSGTGRKGL